MLNNYMRDVFRYLGIRETVPSTDTITLTVNDVDFNFCMQGRFILIYIPVDNIIDIKKPRVMDSLACNTNSLNRHPTINTSFDERYGTIIWTREWSDKLNSTDLFLLFESAKNLIDDLRCL